MKVWLCSEKDFYTVNQCEILDFLPVHNNWPPDVTFAVMEEVHACSISRSEYHSLYILGPG